MAHQNRATVSAPASRRFQLPWEIKSLVLLYLAAALVIGITLLLTSRSAPAVQPLDSVQGKPDQQAQIGPAPAVMNNPPVQNTGPVVATPVVTLITLKWQEVETLGFEYYNWGKDENGVVYSSERYGGAIKIGEFIGTGRTKDAIVYIKDVRMTIGSSRENPLEFSPDGEHWLRGANLPEQALNAQIRGAVWDGEDILIIANWAYEPWEYRGYVARVTPQDQKGLLK